MGCRQVLPFSGAEPLQNWTHARHCSPGEPCLSVCVCVFAFLQLCMNEHGQLECVCIWAYAKLSCYHAASAAETGV